MNQCKRKPKSELYFFKGDNYSMIDAEHGLIVVHSSSGSYFFCEFCFATWVDHTGCLRTNKVDAWLDACKHAEKEH